MSQQITDTTSITEFNFVNIIPHFIFSREQIIIIHRYQQQYDEHIEARDKKRYLAALWMSEKRKGRAYIDTEAGYEINPDVRELYTTLRCAEEKVVIHSHPITRDYQLFMAYVKLINDLYYYFHIKDYSPVKHLDYLIDCQHYDRLITEMNRLQEEHYKMIDEKDILTKLIAENDTYQTHYETVLEHIIQIEKHKAEVQKEMDELSVLINRHIHFLATNVLPGFFVRPEISSDLALISVKSVARV